MNIFIMLFLGGKMSDSKIAPRYIFGLIVMLTGVLLLLQNMGYIEFTIPSVIFSWQVILIIIGTIFILNAKNKSTGLVLVIVGGLGLIPEYWPAALVLIGLYIIFKSSKVNKRFDNSVDNKLNVVSIFGGGNSYFSYDNLTGGSVTAIFGGSKIDLTDCKLSEGENVVDLLYIFGGSDFIIPSDWQVQIETTSIFGRLTDKRIVPTETNNETDKILVLKGLMLFGSGKIKNI